MKNLIKTPAEVDYSEWSRKANKVRVSKFFSYKVETCDQTLMNKGSIIAGYKTRRHRMRSSNLLEGLRVSRGRM